MIIDISALDRRLKASLSLLRRTYADSDAGGGWYHQLDMVPPGPTATGVALTAFHQCGERSEHFTDALTFLKARQISSEDPLLDGGWAMNTSFGLPVMEATGWVARYLGLARCALVDDGPSTARAYQWIINNQNEDGGWGSLRGCPSRVWLTCLALRALAQLNPRHSAVNRGVEWLLARQNRTSCGWGENDTRSPTVTHTAFVLITLAEVGADRTGDAILNAYQWLETHVDPSVIDDPHARIESYNVSRMVDGNPAVWHTILLHYGMPIALSAMLRHPGNPPADVICAGFDTINRTQLDGGHWPNIQGGDSVSIWALWPFVQALTDIRDLSPVRSADQITWSHDLVVVQRQEASGRPLSALLRAQRWLAVTRFFARTWASLLLILSTVTGLILVGIGRFSWKDYVLGMILPIGLLLIQEARQRHRR
ncbi:prenyltransferase/squalene oxidase repeat-containing protein [Sphaerisporangium sp. NPDC049002]|uniref:prenyltransferase/squalene oxidase repeat-containing protein n=1 Tax=Sphaerisporangium sp. NPDC049002 TaxID=3155392 RepID=UPI0033C96BB9